ncbi:hypothetical protein SAMN04487979_104153 [Flavobacterium sp. ov086]|nr:hypothetical protein SAMN04487979_104153 [Flavobacterium sp. ov086]
MNGFGRTHIWLKPIFIFNFRTPAKAGGNSKQNFAPKPQDRDFARLLDKQI